MGDTKHPSLASAVASHAEAGPRLAGLLTNGDKRLREKASGLPLFPFSLSISSQTYLAPIELLSFCQRTM